MNEKRPRLASRGRFLIAVYAATGMAASRSRGTFSLDPNTYGDIDNAHHRHSQGLRAPHTAVPLQRGMGRQRLRQVPLHGGRCGRALPAQPWQPHCLHP